MMNRYTVWLECWQSDDSCLKKRVLFICRAVANFIVLDLGDKFNSGIGQSYWPVRLHRLAGRCDNPMPESTISPSQGL